MKCRFGLLVLLLITIIFTQGCWGSQETDELGYVILIGIDKGEKNIVKVSFQIAVPQPVEGGEQKKATEVVTVEAASIFGAKELASSFISKNLTFVHNKAVIVSEDIAKEGLSKYINPLVRCRELRRTNYLTVVRGEASEFLEHNKELIFEKYTSRYIDLLMNASKFTGFVPESNIHKFYQGLKSPGLQPITALMAVKNKEDDKITKGQDIGNEKKAEEEMAYLPGDIPRKGGAKIEIIGQVVFRDDKLVGFLNGKETRYYQMLTGDFQKGVFTIPDPEEPDKSIIVLEIKKGLSPEIRVDITEAKTVIEVQLFLEGEILSIQSGQNYEKGEREKILERYVSNYFSREVVALVRKTQKEYQSDIFGFGEYTRKYFGTWEEWVDYRWLEKYSEVDIDVKTNFSICRTGLMAQTAPSHK